MLLQSAGVKKELIYFVKDKVSPSMFQPGDLDQGPGFKQLKRSSSARGPSSASEKRGGAPSSSSSSTGGSGGRPSQGRFLQEVFHMKEIPWADTELWGGDPCPPVQEHVETLQKEWSVWRRRSGFTLLDLLALGPIDGNHNKIYQC